MYDSWRRATSPGPYTGLNLNSSAPASAYSTTAPPNLADDSEYRSAYETATLQKKLMRTEAELASAQSELNIMQRELQESRGEIMALRTDRQHLKNRLEETSATKDVEAAGARHDRTLLIDDNRRFKEENDRMRDQLFAANHERARLEQAVTELRSELGAVNHTMVEQTETIRSLTGQMSRMGPSQMIKYQREVNSDASTISDLSRRIADANNERDKAVSDVAHLEDTLARLKDENMRAALTERRQHEQEIQALEKRITRLQQTQPAHEDVNRGADTAAAQKQFARVRAAYEQQIVKLKGERDDLEKELKQAQDQCKRLKDSIAAAKDKSAAETEAMRNQLRAATTTGGFEEVLLGVEGCTNLLDRHPEEPTLSDPFVIVRDNLLGKEIIRTVTAQDTLCPTYDVSRNGVVVRVGKPALATSSVAGRPRPSDVATPPAFTAEVWSYRDAPQQHEFLGCAHLTAEDMLSIKDGSAVRQSIPLQPRDKETDSAIITAGKKLGSITFSLQKKAAVSVNANTATVVKGNTAPANVKPVAVVELSKIKKAPSNVLIHVKGCNDLLSRDVLGSSDPFVVISGPDGKELKRTPTADGTANPQWTLEKASARITLQEEVVPAGAKPSMIVFEVTDHDPVGAGDFLGEVRIPVNDILKAPGTRVLQLQPREKENDPVIKENAAKLGTITLDFSMVVGDELGGAKVAEVKTASDTQIAQALKGGPQEVLVHVVGCTGLQDRDRIGGGDSDPYVIVNDPSGAEVKRTPVVDGNANPTWDLTKGSVKMVIDPKRDVGFVGFEVWDDDLTTADFLGYAQISATELLAGESGRRTIKLGPRPKENDAWVKENKDKLGTITIDVSKLGDGTGAGAEKGRVAPAPPAKGGTYTLLCQVVQCNGVLDRDVLGGHSDPYVVVKTSDNKEVHRTSTKDDTAHPVWDEGNPSDKATCKFTISSGDGGKLYFEVFDEDVTSADFLGVGSVSIQELIKSNFGLKVLDLEPRPNEPDGDIVKNAGKLGTVTVKFTNVTTGALEPTKPVDPKAPAAPAPELPKDPREVFIIINGCRGLMDRDAIGGHSDPFVEVSGPSTTTNKKPMLGKTPTMDNTGDPDFPPKESTFRFTAYPNAKGSIAFDVWDEDTTSNDYLGYASIPVQEIWAMKRPEESRTIKLGCRPDESESYIKEHKDSLGSILVTIKDAPPQTKAERLAGEQAAAAAAKKVAPVVRKVKVCIAGADNVLNRDSFIGTGVSDVYVCAFGPKREVLCKTDVIKDNNTNPRWPVTNNSSFVHVASDEVEAAHYYFEVWDEDVKGSDFLGCAKLPLAVVATQGNVTHTLKLEPREKETDPDILGNKGKLGTLTIEIREPDGAVGKGADAAKEQLAEQKTKEAEAAKNPSAVAPPAAPKKVLLNCYVMGLQNILDLDGFGTGESDATVTGFGPNAKIFLQTPTVDNTLNPTWPPEKGTGTVEVEAGAGQTLTFKAEDVDVVGRDFLGEAKISVDDALKAVNGQPMVVSLINNTAKGNPGTITIKFST